MHSFARRSGQPPVRSQRRPIWRSDLRQLVDQIRLLHPSPFTKIGSLTFQRAVSSLEQRLPGMTDEQRMVAAMRLVASLGDGHTTLQPDNARFANWYPIRLYEFSDGIFVTSAHVSAKELVGRANTRDRGAARWGSNCGLSLALFE
jgi:hypothetical protein